MERALIATTFFLFRVGTLGSNGRLVNKEITSLKDIKGLKMRIPGLGGEVFEAAGGTAVRWQLVRYLQACKQGD